MSILIDPKRFKRDEVILNLTETHKTVKNIKETGGFTVGIADSLHIKEADYCGIVSGNNTSDKFQKSGLTAIKSEFVNAPIINEFPVVMECKLVEFTDYGVVGEIINVSVDDKVLGDDEKIDASKIHALIYDTFNHGYYEVGNKVGQAFSEGKKIM